MAKTGNLLSFHLLAEFLHLLFILEASKSSALSIKLIHRHSLDSPFYPGNISHLDRIRLSTQAASLYAARLSTAISSGIKTNISVINKSIRPRIVNQDLMYLVQVGIGTFPRPRPRYNKYFLHLDTGSDIMWTQCEECRKMGRGSCFRQKAPLFPAANSSSYHPLPCGKHPLCIPGECINYKCSYLAEYADGANTFGYLATESLTFDSDKNKTETIKDIVFGCGIRNKGFVESSSKNLAAGNLGLGIRDHSFLKQKSALTQGRFSYCLPPWDVAHKSAMFLRFGSDIPQRDGFKVTPLRTTSDLAMYFVDLKGVSIGNRKLDVQPKILARTNGHGGCIVDSGSSITMLPPFAYQKLKTMLIMNHFSRYKKMKKQGILDLCYRFPHNTGLKDLPTITFHLQDADLVFSPQVGFTIIDKYQFCLAMWSDDVDGMTIIGAQQQANKRFVFDTVNMKLYFGPEDCTRGA